MDLESSLDATALKLEDGEEEVIPQIIYFYEGIVLQIPGLPLVPGTLRLTNYRVLFVPFQRRFAEHRRLRNYMEVPLGSIHSMKINVIDRNHRCNVSHQQLMAYHYRMSLKKV